MIKPTTVPYFVSFIKKPYTWIESYSYSVIELEWILDNQLKLDDLIRRLNILVWVDIETILSISKLN
jgi:hypothetical protein